MSPPGLEAVGKPGLAKQPLFLGGLVNATSVLPSA